MGREKELLALCMIIVVVSFLGFVVENIWLAITKGFMDNRNMYLPFLVGYGLAIMAIFMLFGTPMNPWFLGRKFAIEKKLLKRMLYFLLVMLCVCVGEILLGTLVEKLCHFYWWDYSRLPLHITRYTTLPTGAGFAVMITVFMEHFFVPLAEFFMTWNMKTLRFIAIGMMMLLMQDFVINAYRMYKDKKMTKKWEIDMTNSLGYRLLHS